MSPRRGIALSLSFAITACGHPAARVPVPPQATARGAALASGRTALYVMPLPRTALDPRREVRRLLARVPWLAAAGRGIVPLADTRHHAVARRGAAAVTVDWDGTLRVR